MSEPHFTVQYYISNKLALDWYHTGSRVICDPPPTDTDDDYILLVAPEKLSAIHNRLVHNHWERGGSFHGELSSNPYEGDKVEGSVFSSWKKAEGWEDGTAGTINLIVTISPEFYENFKLATRLSKKLNLTDKADRISVFHAVCYDQWPESSNE